MNDLNLGHEKTLPHVQRDGENAVPPEAKASMSHTNRSITKQPGNYKCDLEKFLLLNYLNT